MMVLKKTILLIIITFINYVSYAAELNLPKLPDEKHINQTAKTSKESFFQKIKDFFTSKKSNPVVHHLETKQEEPFIDLGNAKFPPIKVEKTENLPIVTSLVKTDSKEISNEQTTKDNLSIPEPSKPTVAITVPQVPEPIENKPIEQKTPAVLEKKNEDIVKASKESVAISHNNKTVAQDVIVRNEPIKPEPTPEQLKFANDEATVLLLANDDVVLGEVTDKAKISLMNAQSFVDLLYKDIELDNEIKPHKKILDFIRQYNKIFPDKTTSDKETMEQIYDEAVTAVNKENISDLKTLIDNYLILQLTNSDGQSLLHIAAINGNYTSAKYLIMKGININRPDYEGYTATIYAQKSNNDSIYKLLTRAGWNKLEP